MPADRRPSSPRRDPPPSRMVRRALARRCPNCGGPDIFQGYFSLRDQCPSCGLHFQRHEGQWSGDIGINTVVSFTLLYLVLLGGTLLTWGHINYVAIAIAAGFATFVFPALFVPFAKDLWLAIDLITRPSGTASNSLRREEV